MTEGNKSLLRREKIPLLSYSGRRWLGVNLQAGLEQPSSANKNNADLSLVVL